MPAPDSSPPCPICKAPGSPKYRPFCSLRCANVDLGRWFGGGYAIPSESEADKDVENEAVGDQRDSAGEADDGT